jgi:RNA polymerase sigma-19 factor, ECF subfamily
VSVRVITITNMSEPVPSELHAQAFRPLPQERDWAAGIRAGDPAAFERAFRAYHPGLCALACRYVRSRDVAQELVHDVFAKLWEERGRLSVGNLKNYLYAAVHNVAISHVRHELVERRWRERAPGMVDWLAQPHDVNEGERCVESEELVAAIQKVLSALPERCRLALTLRWQRQMSYAEVAEAMGISVKTVEIHVGRGLAALRESYRNRLPRR